MAWPTAGHFIEALIDSTTGTPIVSGTYFIYASDGVTLATVYGAANRSTSQTQPLTTSADGDAEFWAEPGKYVLKAGASALHIDVAPSVDDLTSLVLNSARTNVDNNFSNHVLSNYRNLNREYTDTTYSYSTTNDLGATVALTNASAITASLPPTASIGEGLVVVQKGAGQVTFVVSGTSTLKNAHSHTKTFGQDAIVYLECTANIDNSSAVWRLTGDTAA